MTSRLEDHALIGDRETAALVARDGSVDWLCLPRFDAGACFAALLGKPEHGRFKLAPRADFSVSRRYLPGTLVLETEMRTASGTVRLLDFMPVAGDQHDLVRIVEGVGGEVDMSLSLTIRFDYGSIVPWVRAIPGGLRAVAGADTLFLLTPVEMHGENMHTVGDFRVAAGQRVPFVLTWAATYGPPPAKLDAEAALADTIDSWRAWSARSTYRGPYREAVERSLITLKALTYAPSGGIVAAPTTSLPEQPGGVRNWDYRYCWLRDATFTLLALLRNGYLDEAKAWREWLVNAVAGSPEQVQAVYGVCGERRLVEQEIPWLPGFGGARPVRIGNAAALQHQLDVYGELLDVLHVTREAGVACDGDATRVQKALLDFLESDWRREDEGIWEIRGPSRHFVHSKVMAWVGFDRAVRAVEEYGEQGPVERWKAQRDAIHAEVCARGFDPGLGSFVQHYGSTNPDASLLVLPLVGFLPPDDPRVRGTLRYVEKRLLKDGLVLRYVEDDEVDGLVGDEGVFLLCSFWLADALLLDGRRADAEALFERLLELRNDVGLLSEEYEPASRAMLGNFPQAFSHVGLVNTAHRLSR